ncbi:hypothetical protein [Proteiniphilum saccharofermentans]|jgi:hypothetical protein|uniref:hypothetical protein n=1 Tax=Proteiniphilum saccharofermentans TaxID=1642647 RepID=UPI0028ABBF71|nr:hypothetical protein [Proteiniphilum saccharofermentans]
MITQRDFLKVTAAGSELTSLGSAAEVKAAMQILLRTKNSAMKVAQKKYKKRK